jgi:hypothetical protein
MATDESLPAPNYHLPIDELLLRLARYFVMQDQGSTIIEQAGLAFRREESSIRSCRPTWEATYARPYNDDIAQEKSDITAAGSTLPLMTLVADGILLHVRRAILDTIEAVTLLVTPPGLGNLHSEAVTTIRDLLPETRLTDTQFDGIVAPFDTTQSNHKRAARASRAKRFIIETLLHINFVADHRIHTDEGAAETRKLTRDVHRPRLRPLVLRMAFLRD